MVFDNTMHFQGRVSVYVLERKRSRRMLSGILGRLALSLRRVVSSVLIHSTQDIVFIAYLFQSLLFVFDFSIEKTVSELF